MADLFPNQLPTAGALTTADTIVVQQAGTPTTVEKSTIGNMLDTAYSTTPKTVPIDADKITFWNSVTGVLTNFTFDNLTTYIKAIFSPSSGASLIGFIQSGIGAVARTLQDKNRDVVSVKDFGAVGDGTTDDTEAIQTAIDYCNSAGIGTLYAPPGNFLGNWTIKSNVLIRGSGENATKFTAAINAPVFATPLNISTTFIGFEHCQIIGQGGVANDGIALGTTTAGTFVDTISINNVRITGCGRYGIYAFGTSTSGPFVQKLHIDKCTSLLNSGRGLYLHGTVIETGVSNSFFVKNGPNTGATPNASIDLNTGAAGRVAFTNCAFNHFNALSVGNQGIALEISAAEQVTLNTCSFESADPYISITNNLTSNTAFYNNKFASNYAITTAAISITECNGVIIDGCEFVGGTSTGTIAVTLAGTTWSRARNIEMRNNTYGINFTVPISYPITPLRVVYGGLPCTNKYQVQDTHDATAVTDDVDSIFGPNKQQSVLGAINNGVGLIRLTVTGHGYLTGDICRVEDIGGVAEATGQWALTVIDSNTIDLQGSVFSTGPYSSAGRILDVSTTGLDDGREIVLKTFNSGRDLVVKHGTGNVLLNGATDATLTSNTSTITLKWVVGLSKWVESGRCLV